MVNEITSLIVAYGVHPSHPRLCDTINGPGGRTKGVMFPFSRSPGHPQHANGRKLPATLPPTGRLDGVSRTRRVATYARSPPRVVARGACGGRWLPGGTVLPLRDHRPSIQLVHNHLMTERGCGEVRWSEHPIPDHRTIKCMPRHPAGECVPDGY
jgi:hypothetical protein